MITFRKITEDNFNAILSMKRPDGEGFVASNSVSLAQAWLYRDEGDVFPFAIYHDNTPVGFMMLEEDSDHKALWLWRIMFPQEYSGRGYGTEAVRLLATLAKESLKYKVLCLNCNERNSAAMHVYKKLGFQLTGKINHGDLEMQLELG